MARRKIREYHAKRMVAAALGLELKAVLVGPDFNFEMLARDNPWLLTTQLVVKPDMLFGQRGKNNLVLLNVTWEEVMDFLRSRIGDSVTVNGVEGVLSHFIVEPFVAHEGEYYVSLVTDREGVLIHFNALGGVDVEDTWDEHTKDLHIATDSDMTAVDLSPLFAEVGDDDRTTKLDAFVRELFKIFESHDFTTLEINPVVIDEAGQVCMLDLVSELDDTALFMNSRLWGPVDFPLAFGNAPTPEEMYVRELDEKTGASLKLTVLNPEGRIWNLVAGGGASVIFADTVADLGSGDELGSYGEYSGGPNDEETYNYARTLLGLATRNPDGRRRALLVAGGIANFTDIFKTFKGIIHAFGEFKDEIAAANMKIFVRRAGPNYIRGLKSMRDFADESGLDIVVFGPEVTMTHIVPLAVNYINGIDD